MLKMSHVLYKVKDLHGAVKRFEELGFTVEYGADPKKATNAMIWFEEGPFLELFTTPNQSLLISIVSGILRLIGKSTLALRVKHYGQSKEGFCDWSIESESQDITKWIEKTCSFGLKCQKVNVKRMNVRGERLFWQLGAPASLDFPFLMSAYNIDQRPKKIAHKNGAKSISMLTVGMPKEEQKILEQLFDDDRLVICDGHGIKDIQFDGLTSKIVL